MIENTVTLSPELAENLQKLAQAAQLSVNEFIELLAERYRVERLAEIKHTDKPEPGEIAEVLASIEEAEKPEAIWYTDEEVAEIFENYTPAKSRRTIKNSGQA